MRKRIATIFLLAILMCSIIFFSPHKIIKTNDDVYFRYIAINDDYIIPNKEMIDHIMEMLENLYCYRVFSDTRVCLDDVTFEIYLMVNQKPVYISFGKRDFCYSSSKLFRQFDIINADTVEKEIIDLLQLN